jgi:lysophospholipase L1-like esterase
MSGRQAERLIYRGLLLIFIVTVLGLSLWPAQTWFAGKSADPHADRAALLAFLERGYPLAALALAALTGLALAGVVPRRHSSGRLRPILARGALVGATTLLGLLLAEGSAAAYLAWVHRAPRLAMTSGAPSPAGSNADATIVVVGESSAEGVPYRDWLSVGKIVVWQLRRLFPQRMFHVEVQARPGWTLEHMQQKLAETRRPPDVVIIFAGHNEFASRVGWSSNVPYYRDDPGPSPIFRLAQSLGACSPLCRLVRETRERELVAARPPQQQRPMADVPSHTADQYRARLDDFQHRLEAMVTDLKRAGVVPILVVPPGNDAGFEPSRSILPPDTPRADRDAFCRQVLAARALEAADPAESIKRYRALIENQPGFAECHFRLARLLGASGSDSHEAAYREYVLARDLDAHPMRCPTPFQDVYRDLAARHDALLVDGQAVFHSRHPHGLLDDSLFNDGMHPSLEGHVALAESILAGLKVRQVFGWPSTLSVPRIDLAECARHFDVTTATWKEVCRFAAGFYRTTSAIRFDPSEREAKAARYEQALRRLEANIPAESLGMPGLGVQPVAGTLP